MGRNLLLDRALNDALIRRVSAVFIHPVKSLDKSAWRWELRELRFTTLRLVRDGHPPDVAFITDREWSTFAFRLRLRALTNKLYHDDDTDVAPALGEVVRDLLNHLRERLGIEDFPDQERGVHFAVEKAQATVRLSAVLFATEWDT